LYQHNTIHLSNEIIKKEFQEKLKEKEKEINEVKKKGENRYSVTNKITSYV